METRLLGDSGIEVSVVGLGCNNLGWRIDEPQSRAVVDAAFEAGISLFDTADIYGGGNSERFLGAALRGRRGEAVVTTKIGREQDGYAKPGGSRSAIRARVDASLARLATDYVDVLYYHFPDGVTPPAETLGYMSELVDEGKARAIGCSNFDPGQLRRCDEAATASGGSRFVALQNEYSLLAREAEREILPLCRERRIGFVPSFPLANGLLTGKYRRDQPPPEGSRVQAWNLAVPDERWDAIDVLRRFAEERGHTLHDLAMSALVAEPGVASVPAGATRPEQVRLNIAAAGWRLSADELLDLRASLAAQEEEQR